MKIAVRDKLPEFMGLIGLEDHAQPPLRGDDRPVRSVVSDPEELVHGEEKDRQEPGRLEQVSL